MTCGGGTNGVSVVMGLILIWHAVFCQSDALCHSDAYIHHTNRQTTNTTNHNANENDAPTVQMGGFDGWGDTIWLFVHHQTSLHHINDVWYKAAEHTQVSS